MVLIFGETKYGKVDRIPGLFHVVSSFFHLYYVPIIPMGTFVMIEGTKDVGRKIGFSGKSILIAYLRAYGFLGALITTCIPIVTFLEASQKRAAWDVPWEMIGIAVVCWIVFALTYRISRPSLPRALELAQELGIPLDTLAEHFANDAQVQRMFAELKESHFTPAGTGQP